MTPAVTRPPAPPDDALRAALEDPAVRGRLLAQARAVLGRALAGRPAHLLAEAAADAVQAVAVRALERWPTYDATVGPVSPWLSGIMVRVLHETVRGLKGLPAQAPTDPVAWEAMSEKLAREAAAGEAALIAADVLARLSADHRAILRLRFEDGLSHQEIAARLRISLENARVRYHRALDAARDIAGSAPGEDRR